MNSQKEEWKNKFGEDYTKRNMLTPSELNQLYLNRYGHSRSEMNHDFLDFLDRDINILEVGSNIGNQLNLLSKMGFENLYGVEINPEAIKNSNKLNADIPLYVIKGDALNLPFKNEFFELVFTSGVLIHINPDNIDKVVNEICRCSNRYIWGFEYYTENGYLEVEYRGKSDMLWKTDFKSLYLDNFPEMKLIKECLYPYHDDNELVDQMFLLEK
ncbi:Methyltransferase domain protein [anaerobic digester metagenome]